MFCIRMISPTIEPLSPDTTAGNALLRMEEAGVRHLPVSENGIFQGVVSEDVVVDVEEGVPISALRHSFIPSRVRPTDLFTLAARSMVSMDTDMVAVVGEQGEYEGVVTRDAVFLELAGFSGVSGGGSVLVLETDRISYSPGEIVRLVESNDAVLTQLHTRYDPSTSVVTVLVTVNREDVSDIAAGFQRHGYEVRHHEGQSPERDGLMSNLENLLNYLNV